MKRTGMALAVGALMLAVASAPAQRGGATGAERGLIGINLFDPGVRVVSVYGTPDEIQAVNIGGGAQAGGGFGGPSGAPGGGGFGGPARGRAGGGGGSGATPSVDAKSPFGFGDKVFFQGAPPMRGPVPPAGPQGGPPGGFPGGPPGGFPGGAPGAPSAPGGGAPGRGFGGAADTASFTRWVYNRNGSKYGFIIDKFGRVVQIEAIGLQNARVKTRKGIGFGNTFAQVIKAYRTPDGYEISGDQVLVKFLTRSKVAFRLSRLGPEKPQVVTGIVVAAGKG